MLILTSHKRGLVCHDHNITLLSGNVNDILCMTYVFVVFILCSIMRPACRSRTGVVNSKNPLTNIYLCDNISVYVSERGV